MNFFSLMAFSAYAAASVISPITRDSVMTTLSPTKPNISFGQIVPVLLTPTPQVLGNTSETTPGPTPILFKKQSYTIALLGDSMIDTLGTGVPALQTVLKTMYPRTPFTLLNYGTGGTNIDYGIERITNSYTYLGNTIPSLVSRHPDIVVIESFAYNPFPDARGEDRYRMGLANIVDTIHEYLPDAKIIIAATIAPNSFVFGDGAPGIAFSRKEKILRTTTIKQYLEDAVVFAAFRHLPLADAYHASLDGNGEGKLIYINNGDHIHYSDSGRELFAKIVANTLKTVL
jgi:lysophospholipase L1-like esterase